MQNRNQNHFKKKNANIKVIVIIALDKSVYLHLKYETFGLFWEFILMNFWLNYIKECSTYKLKFCDNSTGIYLKALFESFYFFISKE